MIFPLSDPIRYTSASSSVLYNLGILCPIWRITGLGYSIYLMFYVERITKDYVSLNDFPGGVSLGTIPREIMYVISIYAITVGASIFYFLFVFVQILVSKVNHSILASRIDTLSQNSDFPRQKFTVHNVHTWF